MPASQGERRCVVSEGLLAEGERPFAALGRSEPAEGLPTGQGRSGGEAQGDSQERRIEHQVEGAALAAKAIERDIEDHRATV